MTRKMKKKDLIKLIKKPEFGKSLAEMFGIQKGYKPRLMSHQKNSYSRRDFLKILAFVKLPL